MWDAEEIVNDGQDDSACDDDFGQDSDDFGRDLFDFG